MNKFRIPNPSGGFQLYAHDLNFIYDSIKEAMEGLSRGFNNSILYGCRLTGGGQDNGDPNSTYSAGFVSINGEIYFFPGQTWNNSVITDPCFVPNEEVMSPSPVVAADTTSKDVHFKRIVVIEQYGAQAVKFRHKELYDYADPFKTVINPGGLATVYDILYNNSNQWRSFTSGNFDTLKFRKIGKYLEIVGCCKTTDWQNTQVMFTLPQWAENISFRPLKAISIVVPASSGASLPNYMMNVTIETDGTVTETSGTFSAADDPLTLYFNHRIPLF